MKKNKGFTLIELVIAISVFTIVIGLGYNIMNKTNFAIKEQSIVTANQLNVNLINKYVTRDLEKSKEFDSSNEDIDYSKEINYSFTISDGKNNVEYKVKKYDENGKKYYDLTRVDNRSNIELAKKQIRITDIPFIIKTSDENKNIYTVQIDNIDDKSGKYVFDVSSRLYAINNSESGGETDTTNPDTGESDGDKVEEKPEDKFEESYKLSYWIKDSATNSNNVLMGLLHTGQKQANGVKDYKKENIFTANSYNKYDISMKMSLNNSGQKDNMTISNGKGGLLGGDNFQTQNLHKQTDQLVIEVGEGTKFELNVSSGNIITLESGIYVYKINNSSKTLELSGTIIKEVNNSYINICYGKGK